MKILQLWEKLFSKRPISSRDQVTERLKLLLSQDRTTVSPQILEAMTKDILQVVSRYVEVAESGIEISLEIEQRTTFLIANLPIGKVRQEVAVDDHVQEKAVSFIVDL